LPCTNNFKISAKNAVVGIIAIGAVGGALARGLGYFRASVMAPFIVRLSGGRHAG
jgi:outer membrane lipoprotein SlyB